MASLLCTPALLERVMGPGTGESLGTGKMGLSILDEMGVWRAPLLVVRSDVGNTGLIRLATGVCRAEIIQPGLEH